MGNGLIVKVKSNGIMIPIDKLKGINKGDVVRIEITKIYMSKRIKKDFIYAFNVE